MKNFILCFLMLVATSSVVRADATTFEATVNSTRISLDEVLQLTLTFTGVNQDIDPISLPVLNGFSAKYLGPSTSVSIVNGNYSSERSFIYNLFPNKVGQFQIPPISAAVAGQTYTTKPINVEVFQSTSQAQASTSSQTTDQNQVTSTESLNDKILLIASVEKKDVYLNERVPLTVILLINGVPIRDIQMPQFDKTGILTDDFDKPQQGSKVINGINYDVVEFKTNIYPNQLGDLSIGPVQIQGNVQYKTGQNNPFGSGNDFFGSNMFNNFFDSYATRPVTITSKPILLHVSPLPEVNRPNDFSGAIGQFDFQASVSPLQVNAGDPITLKMDVQGSGNFSNVKMPFFQAPGFKSYQPEIKDTGNEKTAEEVIIPTSVDIKQVPALHFSYFDTSTNDYKTIIQGPFVIRVTAPSPDQQFKAVGFSNVSNQTLMQPANQFSFWKMLNKIKLILEKLFRSIWFWVSLGFIIIAGISYFLWRRFQDRLENDPAFARRFKAAKEARQALHLAEGYISSGKTKDFYAILSKALHDYLGDKWHKSSAALGTSEILNHLKTLQIDETYIGQIKTILEQCDLVCFAGAVRDASQMRADLLMTRNIIAGLERFLT